MFEKFKRIVGGIHLVVLFVVYLFYFVLSAPDLFSEPLVRESVYFIETLIRILLLTSLFGTATALVSFIKRDLSDYTMILFAKAMFGLLSWFVFLEKSAKNETISLFFVTLFT